MTWSDTGVASGCSNPSKLPINHQTQPLYNNLCLSEELSEESIFTSEPAWTEPLKTSATWALLSHSTISVVIHTSLFHFFFAIFFLKKTPWFYTLHFFKLYIKKLEQGRCSLSKYSWQWRAISIGIWVIYIRNTDNSWWRYCNFAEWINVLNFHIKYMYMDKVNIVKLI